MTHLLQVTNLEWQEANAFFAQNANEVKFRKPSKRNQSDPLRNGHSFIKVNGVIYAMANGLYLGQGASSRVKIIQNEQGDNFKVNIRLSEEYAERDEQGILTQLNQFKGAAKRDLPKEILVSKPTNANPNNKIVTSEKHYKVMELIEGTSLEKRLIAKPLLTRTQSYIIAIKWAQALLDLHETHRIIHRDIKPANLVVREQGNHIDVSLIDFGCSKRLAPNVTEYRSGGGTGTPRFIAPEIADGLLNAPYTFNSDIYALGEGLRQLKFHDQFIALFKTNDPNSRINLKRAINSLVNRLGDRTINNCDDATAQVINSYPHTRAAKALRAKQSAQVSNNTNAKPVSKTHISSPPPPPPPPPPVANQSVTQNTQQKSTVVSAKKAIAGGYFNNCGLHGIIHTLFSLPEEQQRQIFARYPIFNSLFEQLYRYYQLPGQCDVNSILALNQTFNHPEDREILWGQVFRKTLQALCATRIEARPYDLGYVRDYAMLDSDFLGDLANHMGANFVIHNTVREHDYMPKVDSYRINNALWDVTLKYVGGHFDFSFSNRQQNAAHNNKRQENSLLSEATKLQHGKDLTWGDLANQRTVITQLVKDAFDDILAPAVNLPAQTSPLVVLPNPIVPAVDLAPPLPITPLHHHQVQQQPKPSISILKPRNDGKKLWGNFK